jgi:hypothetical protein
VCNSVSVNFHRVPMGINGSQRTDSCSGRARICCAEMLSGLLGVFFVDSDQPSFSISECILAEFVCVFRSGLDMVFPDSTTGKLEDQLS